MRLAPVAIVLASCWTGAPPPPQPPAPDPVEAALVARSTAWQPRRMQPIPRHSVWQGTYRCGQGLTSVRLTLITAPNGSAEATFEFGPVPDNPGVPEGSFELGGTVEKTGPDTFTAELEPTRWLVRPVGYMSTRLSIEADRLEMTGVLQHPDCSDFRAKRL